MAGLTLCDPIALPITASQSEKMEALCGARLRPDSAASTKTSPGLAPGEGAPLVPTQLATRRSSPAAHTCSQLEPWRGPQLATRSCPHPCTPSRCRSGGRAAGGRARCRSRRGPGERGCRRRVAARPPAEAAARAAGSTRRPADSRPESVGLLPPSSRLCAGSAAHPLGPPEGLALEESPAEELARQQEGELRAAVPREAASLCREEEGVGRGGGRGEEGRR